MNAREALDVLVGDRAGVCTVEVEQEALDVLRDLVDLGIVWLPRRWWRVDLPDGTCWAESSDESEVRASLVTARQAVLQRGLDGEPVLYRMWETSTSRRYRVVQS